VITGRERVPVHTTTRSLDTAVDQGMRTRWSESERDKPPRISGGQGLIDVEDRWSPSRARLPPRSQLGPRIMPVAIHVPDVGW
jgi:hypothetical protein